MTRDFWEGYVPEPQYSVNCVNHDCDKCKAAAQPAPVQEPVATVRTWHMNGDQHAELGDWELGLFKLPDGEHTLYTTPPAAQRQWVGLTDEEVMQTMSGDWTSQFYFARAIEAKLKEKNT